MIFDCHTHWGDCYTERDGLDPRNWLAVLNRHGVDKAFVLPFAGLIHGGRIARNNDEIAAACRASGGRMIPFCTANTWYAADAVGELRRCFEELGFVGIKFHPWLQGAPITSTVMDQVCEIAEAHHAPILFHDGTPPFSLPSQVAVLARRHPRVRMILGHCGLLEHWREAIATLNSSENIWGCLCSPHLAAIHQLLQHCDRHRLLWGSDFGFTFQDSIDYRLKMMNLAGMDEATRRMVFDENPRRLLGEV